MANFGEGIKMTKAENYLYDRLKILSDEKVIIITKINNIEIEVEEINHKITEISKDVDDTFEIFSPRVKKNDFIRGEIESLKEKRDELLKKLEDLNNQSSLVDGDILLIKDALGENEAYEEEIDKAKNDIYEVHRKNTIGLSILEMQENERQRIARDLHDSIVQVLANLVHKCEICSKVMNVDIVRAKLELEIMSKTLVETIDEMRNVIYDLRPMSFDDLGFETTLTRIINKIKESTDMEIRLSVSGDFSNINSIITLTLIRIVEEACNNSLKYSKGKYLDVKVVCEDKNIHLEIVDDGEGFVIDEILNPEENNNRGFGIKMMKERVFLLSGEMSIESKINEGTKISIEVPIQ